MELKQGLGGWVPLPSLVNECRTIKLHLTMLDERSKAGRKREPATGSEHLLVDMKIAIPMLSSIGSNT